MSTLTPSNPSQTAASGPLNGIDPTAVREAVSAITDDPAAGLTNWAITSRWQGGTRTDHFVDGFTMGGQQTDRQFKIQIDEPLELNGTNQFANPQEHLIAALNACMMVGYATNASVLGIELTKLEVETTGDIDLRGFLEIDESVKNGYDSLEQTVRLSGKATAAELQELHETVVRTSVNYFNLTEKVPVNSRLVLE